MTTQEKRKAITNVLNHMIAEGIVVKVKGGYRLKTKSELKKEMRGVLNENY